MLFVRIVRTLLTNKINMAGVSSEHKRKIKLARKMLTREERARGVGVFDGGQWRFRAYMRNIKTSPILMERHQAQKSFFTKMFKKAEKQNAKKTKKTDK
jgi:hypothetical protein